MQNFFFIINAPPFSFSKSDLYSDDSQFNMIGSHIKAIADAFFLSNNFRKNLNLDFFTNIEGEEYVICFEGNKLKYLGPSFFSAAHLLLRTKRHIKSPNSKAGKLTPGLTIKKGNIDTIKERYKSYKKIQIVKEEKISDDSTSKIRESNAFLFGFNDKALDFEKTSLGTLNIDEQVIITNHILEKVNR